MDAELRAAILAALGRRPTAERRRQLADEQEQIAAADERAGHVIRRARCGQCAP